MTATLRLVSRSHGTRSSSRREPLVIGLVNNMPDGALQTTERQFGDLLRVAANEYDIRLRLFSFPELIRGEAGRTYVSSNYEPIAELWNGEFDGLIVTGAEPRSPALTDEVYWSSLTHLVDWASATGTPTIWSCLAAHAAVLHLDGIQRCRLDQKISGVFRCIKSGDDPLVTGLPVSWRVPHSRHNTLDPECLESAGYQILSYSEEVGADTFVVRRQAAFVFFQGHPEYDADALYREYRRDVGRYLAGSVDSYPDMPRGCFDDDTALVFAQFRARAQRQRTRDLLEVFPAADLSGRLAHGWRDTAGALYGNWLRAFVSRASSDAMNGSAAADVATPAP